MASYEGVAGHLREMLPGLSDGERADLVYRALTGAGQYALCLSVGSYELALGAADWWRACQGLGVPVVSAVAVRPAVPPPTRGLRAEREYETTEVGELWRLYRAKDARADAELRRRFAGPQAPPVGLSHGAYLTGGSVPKEGEFTAKLFKGRVQMEFCPTGSLVRSLPCKKAGRTGPGGKRGKVRGFSQASRLRMMRNLAAYERRSMGLAIFITLTYGGDYPSPAVAKKHLDRFIKRLRREYPEAGGLWRLEWQERGAPHYHLLVLGVDFIPYAWTAAAWAAVTDGLASAKSGTETRRVKSYSQSVYYVSKYLAKSGVDASEEGTEGPEGEPTQEPVEGPGRLWGHFGCWRKYQSAKVRLVLERDQAARVARTLDALRCAGIRASVKAKQAAGKPAKHYRARRKSYLARGATWFLNAAVLWSRLEALVGPVKQVCAAVVDAKPVPRRSQRVRAPVLAGLAAKAVPLQLVDGFLEVVG